MRQRRTATRAQTKRESTPFRAPEAPQAEGKRGHRTHSDAWVVNLEEPTGHASGSFCLRPRSLAANVHPGQLPSLRNEAQTLESSSDGLGGEPGSGGKAWQRGRSRSAAYIPSAKRSPEHQLEIVQGPRSGDSKRRHRPVPCRSPRHKAGTDLEDRVGRAVNTVCQLKDGRVRNLDSTRPEPSH